MRARLGSEILIRRRMGVVAGETVLVVVDEPAMAVSEQGHRPRTT